MKKLVLFFSLFLFSCEKDELITEVKMIDFGYCPSDIPNFKVIKFDVFDNTTVDYYMVDISQGLNNVPERQIKLESKKIEGIQKYECEIEMKSNKYIAKLQVVYNKKTSKYFNEYLTIIK